MNLVSVIAAHCIIRRMGYPGNDFCRTCFNEEEVYIQHLLCRQQCAGRRNFHHLERTELLLPLIYVKTA